jgi:hypothetical protein
MIHFIEGSLEVKLLTAWPDGKALGRVREEKGRRKKIREERVIRVWVKTLSPFCSHQNSWDLWMFIPLY